MRLADRASKTKIVPFIRITHRDEVEAPIADWLRAAYEFSALAAGKPVAKRAASR